MSLLGGSGRSARTRDWAVWDGLRRKDLLSYTSCQYGIWHYHFGNDFTNTLAYMCCLDNINLLFPSSVYDGPSTHGACTNTWWLTVSKHCSQHKRLTINMRCFINDVLAYRGFQILRLHTAWVSGGSYSSVGPSQYYQWRLAYTICAVSPLSPTVPRHWHIGEYSYHAVLRSRIPLVETLPEKRSFFSFVCTILNEA